MVGQSDLVGNRYLDSHSHVRSDGQRCQIQEKYCRRRHHSPGVPTGPGTAGDHRPVPENGKTPAMGAAAVRCGLGSAAPVPGRHADHLSDLAGCGHRGSHGALCPLQSGPESHEAAAGLAAARPDRCRHRGRSVHGGPVERKAPDHSLFPAALCPELAAHGGGVSGG